MFLDGQTMGREEGSAALDACHRAPGHGLETVEYGMAIQHPGAVQWLQAAAIPESCSNTTRHINLAVKHTGKPTAGNPHGGFDAAGTGNGFTVRIMRHSQRKRGANG